MTSSSVNPAAATQPQIFSRPPRMPGIPFLTDNLNMLNDPLRYLTHGYKTLGPVFRVRMGTIEYTILAGLEANLFLQGQGNHVFDSKELFGGMAAQFNTDVMLPMVDGEAHSHMRKVMRPGFARSSVAPHVGTVVGIVQEYAERWKSGDKVPVFDTMRRMICDQIGMVSTGMRAGDRFEDIVTFLKYVMNIELLKTAPRILLQRQEFKRARARMLELGREVVEYHRQNPPEQGGRERDLIDDLLANVRPDGDPFTDDDLIQMAVGPYIAGIDTLASTQSFMIYAVLKNPEIRARVEADAENLFANGMPALKDFRNAEALHAAGIEVLRRYPVAPFTPRTVTQPFEFGGYQFKSGMQIMVAQTVTHMLPEYYPEPEKFDIDRHMGKSTLPPGVFAPYSLGAHTCLGAGMAEALMLINMAALLKFSKLDLPSPDYEVSIYTMPLPNPGQKFALTVR
jgi:cytochrome P450